MLKKILNKKGQVWVETVTYTLIAFVLIGLILAFVKPKINELQDKALIQQSTNIMNKIDSVINEVYQDGPGNKRLVEVSLRGGDIEINPKNNSLTFYYEGKYMYSQPGKTISAGAYSVLTTQVGPEYKVSIGKSYPNFNITYDGKNVAKNMTSASNPYELFITYNGGASHNVDFTLK